MYNRKFKLWYYTISHKQMLLRSIGNGDMSNLDIYFNDVLYVDLPTELDKIEILKPTQDDINYITQRIGNTNRVITVLLSGVNKYYVVASVVKIFENNLSMFELPFDIPNDMGRMFNQ